MTDEPMISADAIDSLDDVSFVVEAAGDYFDVVSLYGKTRIVLARTRHEGIAQTLVEALFAKSADAEGGEA